MPPSPSMKDLIWQLSKQLWENRESQELAMEPDLVRHISYVKTRAGLTLAVRRKLVTGGLSPQLGHTG